MVPQSCLALVALCLFLPWSLLFLFLSWVKGYTLKAFSPLSWLLMCFQCTLLRWCHGLAWHSWHSVSFSHGPYFSPFCHGLKVNFIGIFSTLMAHTLCSWYFICSFTILSDTHCSLAPFLPLLFFPLYSIYLAWSHLYTHGLLTLIHGSYLIMALIFIMSTLQESWLS